MDFMKKYAPKTLTDLVFVDDATKRRIEHYAMGQRSGNIVLHGPHGTAKSTTARMISESICTSGAHRLSSTLSRPLEESCRVKVSARMIFL